MWEKNPVLFLVLAFAAIMAGTIVTMVAPFATVNTEADRVAGVKPYTALELAGRDIYIREGCNNCHTQTVRPLVADVLRYGPYSKSGEFVYDRPFLWGSRRTGPDLAREGGKYGDEWHYQHMRDPRSVVPESNMPAYAFLDDERIDPDLTRRKMEVLGFPYTGDEVKALAGKTAMDAIVAYLQKLGNDTGWREAAAVEYQGETKNPFEDDATIRKAGRRLYLEHCSGCHGSDRTGSIGPDISDIDMEEEELFNLIYGGIPGSGMPGFSNLGADRIWKMVTWLEHRGDE